MGGSRNLEHRIGHFFVRPVIFVRPVTKCRKLRMAQSRHHERPRSSRLQHSASFRARNPNKASTTLMLAAASIKVVDALFGFLARNDAECCKRELLGRSWCRDWAMRNFRHFVTGRTKITGRTKKCPIRCSRFLLPPIPPSLVRLFMGEVPKQKSQKSPSGGCGEAAGEVPPQKKVGKNSGGVQT